MNRPSEELIFDRVQEDVLNRTSKGKYEYTDLNRIEEWCQYIAEVLNSYGYYVNVDVKTDWIFIDEEDEEIDEWTRVDMPTVSQMERIRQNVLNLKTAYYSFTQVPSNLNFMTIDKANDIEKILNEIEILINNMVSQFFYSGEIFAGEV